MSRYVKILLLNHSNDIEYMKVGDIFEVIEEESGEYDYTFLTPNGKWYADNEQAVILKKVFNTELARFMYPDAQVKEDYLLVEVEYDS